MRTSFYILSFMNYFNMLFHLGRLYSKKPTSTKIITNYFLLLNFSIFFRNWTKNICFMSVFVGLFFLFLFLIILMFFYCQCSQFFNWVSCRTHFFLSYLFFLNKFFTLIICILFIFKYGFSKLVQSWICSNSIICHVSNDTTKGLFTIRIHEMMDDTKDQISQKEL